MTDTPAARAWIGIGANLGDRLATMRSAVRMLGEDVPDTSLVATSAVYETRPIGPSTEPFLNAAVECLTRLGPRSLLDELHRIETAHRRQRRIRWEARTLDLDLIGFSQHDDGILVIATEQGFVLPHPRAHLRDFVLRPLVDLGAEMPLRETHTAAQLLEAIPTEATTIIRRSTERLAPGRTTTSG